MCEWKDKKFNIEMLETSNRLVVIWIYLWRNKKYIYFIMSIIYSHIYDIVMLIISIILKNLGNWNEQ